MPAERWLPRKALAPIVSEKVRPVSPRSFERWAVRVKYIGKKAHHELNEVLDHARREVEQAPATMQSARRAIPKAKGAADRRPLSEPPGRGTSSENKTPLPPKGASVDA